MDYAIIVISILSLVLNVLMYRRITATYPVPTVDEIGPFESLPLVTEIEKEAEKVSEEPPVTVKKVEEVYQGWRNQRDIPWTNPSVPSAPVKQQTVKGPLQRPDGFV